MAHISTEELVSELRADIKEIRADINEIKIDVAVLKTCVNTGIETKKIKATVIVAFIGFISGLCGTLITVIFK